MKNKAVLLSVMLSLLFVACLEPKDGCLDEQALNYEITADRNCCCEYPGLIVNIDHEWDTLGFRIGDEFIVGQDTLVIEEMQYFLSGFILESANSVSYSVDELIEIDSPPVVVPDDLVLVRPSGAAARAGTFVHPEIQFSRLSFALGPTPEMQNIPPEAFPTDHPARVGAPVLFDTTGQKFCDFYIRVSRASDSNQSRSLLLNISENDFIQKSVDYNATVGFNLDIRLAVDYHAWFEDVDFFNDTNLQISSRLKENADVAIRIVE